MLARRVEAGEGGLAVLAGREVTGVLEGLADLAQRVVGVAQGHVRAPRHEGLRPVGQPQELVEMLLLLLGRLLAGRTAPRAQGGGDRLEPRPEVGQVGAGRGLAPLRVERREGGAGGVELLAGQGLRLLHQGQELLPPGEAGQVRRVALLGRRQGGGHTAVVRLTVSLGKGREPRPLLPGVLERLRDRLALGGVDGRHESRAGLHGLPTLGDLALVRGPGFLVDAALGLLVLLGRRPCRDRGRPGRLPRFEAGPRAPSGGADLRLPRHRLQGLGVRKPLDRGHRHRLLLDLEREGEQGRAVLDPCEGEEPCVGVLGFPDHRGQGLRVGEDADGGFPRRREGGGFCHGREVLRLPQPAERRPRRCLVVLVHRDVREPAFRLVPHARVRVGGGDLRQHGRVRQLLHRSPAHARVGVLASEGEEDLALGGGQAENGVRADGGVGMLPLGLAAEPFDERLQGRLHHGGLRNSDYIPWPRPCAPRPRRVIPRSFVSPGDEPRGDARRIPRQGICRPAGAETADSSGDGPTAPSE